MVLSADFLGVPGEVDSVSMSRRSSSSVSASFGRRAVVAMISPSSRGDAKGTSRRK